MQLYINSCPINPVLYYVLYIICKLTYNTHTLVYFSKVPPYAKSTFFPTHSGTFM